MAKAGVREAIEVLELEARCIETAAKRLATPVGAAAFEKSLTLIEGALKADAKVVVTGVGKSGKIGEKVAATLSSTGTLAVFLHPTEGLHGDLGIVRPKDVVIAISQTGNTDELIKLLPSLKSRGVSLVALCGQPDSQLAQQAKAVLDTSVEREACPNGLAPTSSTTLALALGDALAVSLMKRRGFDAESFARNHPGGALGKRLTLKVQDLMHAGQGVGMLPPKASIEKVIELSTEKKLGAVLVVQGKKLLGIVTDGDIRRALREREKFFKFRAEDVMTTQPVVVSADQMAEEALKLMEDRPSQISVLPVVSAKGEALGLIRLHDLVRAL